MNPYGLATVRLVVIVALADPQLDWLACRLHGRVEVPALALELGRLERTVGEDERGVQAVEMALRAELLLHRIGELDVTVALGEPNRLEIVHSAAEERAFEDIERQPSVAQSVVTMHPPRWPPEEWPVG
jgi:hypothetical protein